MYLRISLAVAAFLAANPCYASDFDGFYIGASIGQVSGTADLDLPSTAALGIRASAIPALIARVAGDPTAIGAAAGAAVRARAMGTADAAAGSGPGRAARLAALSAAADAAGSRASAEATLRARDAQTAAADSLARARVSASGKSEGIYLGGLAGWGTTLLDGRLYLGAEIGGGHSSATASMNAVLPGWGGDVVRVRDDLSGYARIRTGVVVAPWFMAYSLLGAEAVRYQVEGRKLSTRFWTGGPQWGGGIEAAVGGGVFVRAEYSRTELEGGRLAGGKISLSRSIAAVSVGYRF